MKKLSLKQTIIVASTLFGMFFGAGNLIFPVHLGQLAGKNVWQAIIGFIITAVGIPILGVAAISSTHSNGLMELSSRVGKPYGIFFTCLLYLTIGPFFAIPRCATTSFTIGVIPLIPKSSETLFLLLFSLFFFLVVLAFSLKPNEITTWIGKIINPVFIFFLAVLLVAALLNPTASVKSVQPDDSYLNGALFKGFFEGYGTMDAIAGLAFGIVVINVIRGMGVSSEKRIAGEVLKSGLFAGFLMALIYVLTILMGAQSRGVFPISDNGGTALAQISGYYFGRVGSFIIALIFIFACLKTAIGLVISCSEAFSEMFPGKLSYNKWAVILSAFSFVVSNIGLNRIIEYSIPVLMFIYPLAIVLIILAFSEKLFKSDRRVYKCVTLFTGIAAVFDFFKTLPSGVQKALGFDRLTAFVSGILPFFNLGLGWVVPAVIGFLIGLTLHFFAGNNSVNQNASE